MTQESQPDESMPPESSKGVLAEIGTRLREAREARGRTIDDIAVETHLKASHLRALEEGDESQLPEPVYIKGFIRRYASAVGVDGEELANRYWRTRPLPPTPPQRQEFGVPWWVFPWIVGLVLVAILMALYLGTRRVPGPAPSPAPPTPAPLASPSPAPTATASPAVAPSPSPVPSPTPAATPQAAPTAAPAATVSLPMNPSEPFKLRVVAKEPTWLLVRSDDRWVYEGTLATGEAASWSASGSFDVHIGNAAGADLTVGGEHLGTLGGRGEVVRRTFRKETR